MRCCHIDENGTACPHQASYLVQGDDGYEDYTHACAEHVCDMTDSGDKVYILGSDGSSGREVVVPK